MTKLPMGIEEIKGILLHRYPFLLIDRVMELEIGARIVAYKNITHNEPFFQGHFPGLTIMPGVLTLEAMVQAAGILGAKTLENESKDRTSFIEKRENMVYILIAAEKVRYRKPILPGDRLQIEVNILKIKSGIWKYGAVATVDDSLVCEATIYCKAEHKKNLLPT